MSRSDDQQFNETAVGQKGPESDDQERVRQGGKASRPDGPMSPASRPRSPDMPDPDGGRNRLTGGSAGNPRKSGGLSIVLMKS